MAYRFASSLQASPATTVFVYQAGETLARVGVVGESPTVREAPILAKSLQEGKDGRELYLPALQVTHPRYRLTQYTRNPHEHDIDTSMAR